MASTTTTTTTGNTSVGGGDNSGSPTASAGGGAGSDGGGSMDQESPPVAVVPQRATGSGRGHGPRGYSGGGSNGGGNGGNQREYCLRWNNHQPNLVTFFTTLLNKETFVDVTLVSSEGRKLQAHKLVLSACSPYFQHVFENNPCKHPIVILKDVQYADLRTIVSFIYNGEVNISQDRINTILSTASTLQIKGLAEVPADELKRVGGHNKSNSVDNSEPRVRSQIPPLHSAWGSADADENLPQTEIPRKKLKKSTGLGGSTSTNGDHSTGGSFESGVGASMSRSIDEGNGTTGSIEGSAAGSSRGPPPLMAGSQLSQHQKSRSLDTGMALKEEESVHMDSELSSGGFSESQTYDDSSLGADRGYDLEVADVKGEGVSDDENENEFDEELYDHPDNDNSEFNSQSFPNASSSSSLFFQPDRQYAASVLGAGKVGRRGRLLMRQSRMINETPEVAITGAVETITGGIIHKIDSKFKRSSSSHTFSDEFEDNHSNELQRQQSIVPIVTVSGSSPTPPTSPLPKEETSISIKSISASAAAAISRLSIPIPGSLDIVEVGRNTLVKQLSEGQISASSSPVPLVRQYSQPNPGTRLFYPGMKPGDLFQIVPTPEDGCHSEGTYFINSSLVQLMPSEGSSRGRRLSQTREVIKDMEIITREVKREFEGTSFESNVSNVSVDEPLDQPVQRSVHCPVLRDGPSLGCNFCWNSVDSSGRILRRKTKYSCPECKINLCLVPCFYMHHSQADKKKVKRNILPKPSSM